MPAPPLPPGMAPPAPELMPAPPFAPLPPIPGLLEPSEPPLEQPTTQTSDKRRMSRRIEILPAPTQRRGCVPTEQRRECSERVARSHSAVRASYLRAPGHIDLGNRGGEVGMPKIWQGH